jgi:uncharacterized membrane protein (DUF2068 family)
MANTFKALFRGAAPTSNTTLYTVPSGTTTLVNSLVVVNTASAVATFDMSFDSIQIANDVSVPANDSLILELKQVLEASDVLAGLASASTVNFHISGLEIS